MMSSKGNPLDWRYLIKRGLLDLYSKGSVFFRIETTSMSFSLVISGVSMDKVEEISSEEHPFKYRPSLIFRGPQFLRTKWSWVKADKKRDWFTKSVDSSNARYFIASDVGTSRSHNRLSTSPLERSARAHQRLIFSFQFTSYLLCFTNTSQGGLRYTIFAKLITPIL